jgi:nitrite reductase/ring-hydroxylating ferredoxin subunit
MAHIRLCKVTDVPIGELRQFNVKEKEIMIINRDNKFYCLDARCTHAGAPLAEGELNGDILTCPWHGSRFNITNGSVVRGPAREPLRVYATATEEDDIYVDI